MPSAIFLTPMLAFAQYIPGGTNASSLFEDTVTFLNRLVPVLVTVAVVLLIFNVIRFVIFKKEGNAKALQDVILWNVIGLFIILAIWGIIAFLSSSLGIGIGGSSLPVPQPPTL